MVAWRALGLVLAVGACVEPGESGMKAEFARLDAKAQFRVESSSPQRAVFAARGRRVVVEPPGGFCLAPDSLNVAGGAAFALIADCPGAERPFPGIVTVSVSDRSMAQSRTGGGRALSDLQAFLTTPEGLALLGRGSGGAQVTILQTRQLGDALYVEVQDTAPGALPILAPKFWRAFVDVNDRMVLATINGFRDVPADPDALLGHLARQVVHLREANLAPLYDDEVRVARTVDGDLQVASGAVTQAPQAITAIRTPHGAAEAARLPVARPAPVEVAVAPAPPDATPATAPDDPLSDTPDGALADAPDSALADAPDGALADAPDGALADAPDGALADAPDGAGAPPLDDLTAEAPDTAPAAAPSGTLALVGATAGPPSAALAEALAVEPPGAGADRPPAEAPATDPVTLALSGARPALAAAPVPAQAAPVDPLPPGPAPPLHPAPPQTGALASFATPPPPGSRLAQVVVPTPATRTAAPDPAPEAIVAGAPAPARAPSAPKRPG